MRVAARRESARWKVTAAGRRRTQRNASISRCSQARGPPSGSSTWTARHSGGSKGRVATEQVGGTQPSRWTRRPGPFARRRSQGPRGRGSRCRGRRRRPRACARASPSPRRCPATRVPWTGRASAAWRTRWWPGTSGRGRRRPPLCRGGRDRARAVPVRATGRPSADHRGLRPARPGGGLSGRLSSVTVPRNAGRASGCDGVPAREEAFHIGTGSRRSPVRGEAVAGDVQLCAGVELEEALGVAVERWPGFGDGGAVGALERPLVVFPPDAVAEVVEQAVVEAADQDEVVGVGVAADEPVPDVVGLQVAGVAAARSGSRDRPGR